MNLVGKRDRERKLAVISGEVESHRNEIWPKCEDCGASKVWVEFELGLNEIGVGPLARRFIFWRCDTCDPDGHRRFFDETVLGQLHGLAGAAG